MREAKAKKHHPRFIHDNSEIGFLRCQWTWGFLFLAFPIFLVRAMMSAINYNFLWMKNYRPSDEKAHGLAPKLFCSNIDFPLCHTGCCCWYSLARMLITSTISFGNYAKQAYCQVMNWKFHIVIFFSFFLSGKRMCSQEVSRLFCFLKRKCNFNILSSVVCFTVSIENLVPFG
jgi:hypothetical protein